MPLIVLFMVINTIIGCYWAIQFGYGPPHWIKALNLIVPVTSFQNWLNEGRNWLEEKIPRTAKFFTRLHIPKPIILVDVTLPEEGEEKKEEQEEGNEVQEETTADTSDTSDVPTGNMPDAPQGTAAAAPVSQPTVPPTVPPTA